MDKGVDVSSSEGIFYGPRLRSTIAAGLLYALQAVSLLFGFLIVPGTVQFDISVTQYQLWFTIYMLAAMVALPIQGRLIARYGVKIVLAVSGAILIAAGMGMAFSADVTALYLLSIPFGVGWAGSTMTPANTILVGWWPQNKRGRAIGVSSMLGALAGVVYGLFFPALIEAGGYTTGILVMVAIITAMLVLALVLLKNPPLLEAIAAAPAKARVPLSGRTVLVLALLMLASCIFAIEGTFSTIMGAVYTVNGFDAATAGVLVSLFAISSFFVTPVLGWVHDKMGINAVMIIFAISFIIAQPGFVIFLPMAQWSAFVLVPIAAVSLSVLSVLTPLVTARVARPAQFPVFYSLANTGSTVGYAGGAILWGLVFDLTGSFDLAMILGGATGVVAVVLNFFLVRKFTLGAEEKAARDEAPAEGIEVTAPLVER